MIAIIPARSGSKRIKGKNKKIFGEFPIIQGTIKKLISFNIFERIIVSTDDPEILELAKASGAECFFIRPLDLSDDYATTHQVVKHAIKEIKNEYKTESSYCCIYPTNILIEKRYILEGLEMHEKYKDHFVFSCKKYRYPIEKAFYINKGGFSKFQDVDKNIERTQDLRDFYHDAGQFYIASEKKWLSDEQILNNTSVPVVLPQYAGLDIDEPEDWILAEQIYKIRMMNDL
jgi:pseudaminic acid cytidylyltransferase